MANWKEERSAEIEIKKVAIIGAGVSGLTVAQILKDKYSVSVFERENNPGGLIRCQNVHGNLFHICGGHVFNSKRKDVIDWFWSKFVRETEFEKRERMSCVFLDKEPWIVPYPIENHVYLFGDDIQKSFFEDLDEIDKTEGSHTSFTDYENFGDFLRRRFGKTLYKLYFEPYNKKIWRCDLTSVPMSWMEGKLPMPTTGEMRESNAKRIEEKESVHSTFWYEIHNGSQFIADRLAENIDIAYNTDVSSLKYIPTKRKWLIAGEEFDMIVFCGNVKEMIHSIEGVDVNKFVNDVDQLRYHGTTAVFCEIDDNPYTWIYQPSTSHDSHRIICTGNFSRNNNDFALPKGRITATVEFTDEVSKESILESLKHIPLNAKYLTHFYSKYSYPIQDTYTRNVLAELKKVLAPAGFYFTGRFADWEYYNMDAAMGAAIDLCKLI